MLVKYPPNGNISNYRKRDRRRCNFQYGWARPREEEATLYKRAEVAITPNETLADVRIFYSLKMTYLKMFVVCHGRTKKKKIHKRCQHKKAAIKVGWHHLRASSAITIFPEATSPPFHRPAELKASDLANGAIFLSKLHVPEEKTQVIFLRQNSRITIESAYLLL